MRGLKNRLTRSNSLSSRRTVTHHCKVEPDQPDFVFIHRIRKSRLIDWQGSCSLGAGEMLFWIPLLRKRRSLSDSKLFCQILASTSAAGEYCMSLRIRGHHCIAARKQWGRLISPYLSCSTACFRGTVIRELVFVISNELSSQCALRQHLREILRDDSTRITPAPRDWRRPTCYRCAAETS